MKGKGAETFGPLGPWLVTPDEIGDPQNLAMSLDVNGERMQTGSTKTMIFGVAELVSYLSGKMVLGRLLLSFDRYYTHAKDALSEVTFTLRKHYIDFFVESDGWRLIDECKRIHLTEWVRSHPEWKKRLDTQFRAVDHPTSLQLGR